MPRISVLMPAHNAAPYIRKAIRSALQSLPDDAEIVVLDDASTDGTARRVRWIRDRRVRVVTSEQKLGAPAAMRALLAQTDSALVARLDADDLSLPGRFAYQEEELAAGADVSFGKLLHFGKRYRGPRELESARLSPAGVRLALLMGNPLGHSTLLARRSAFDEDSYPTCATEDFATWLGMAARGQRIVLSERPLALYRHHPGQLTMTAEWKGGRWNEQEVVRSAYARLSESVFGITPSTTHALWGPRTPDSVGDEALLDAIDAAIETFEGAERDYLRSMFGWR